MFPLSSTFPPYREVWFPLLSRLKLSWDSETEYPRCISLPRSLRVRHFLFATHHHPKSAPDRVVLFAIAHSITKVPFIYEWFKRQSCNQKNLSSGREHSSHALLRILRYSGILAEIFGVYAVGIEDECK